MKVLFYCLPLIAGVAMSAQAIINGQLRTAIGSPLMTALISFATGTLVLLLINLFTRQSIPAIAGVHWIKLTGGTLGVVVVTAVIISIQKIPSANLFALLVTSQLIAAVLFDHVGWLGIKQTPVQLSKLLGVLLLIAGAYLVNKK